MSVIKDRMEAKWSSLQRHHIVDGVKVATPEYFEALRAVNFMERHGFGWTIDKAAEYSSDLMIEHAKEIAAERGKAIKIVTKLSGFDELGLCHSLDAKSPR